MVIQRLQRMPIAQIFVRAAFHRCIKPHACFAFAAFAVEAVIIHGKYNYFFEAAQVPAEVGFKLIEINDRISHNLAGAVVSDIAAAVDVIVFNSFFYAFSLVYEYVCLVAVLPKSVNRVVFSKEQIVGWRRSALLSAYVLCQQVLLEIPHFFVRA